MKETTDHNSPFKIKIVIAEVESGERLVSVYYWNPQTHWET